MGRQHRSGGRVDNARQTAAGAALRGLTVRASCPQGAVDLKGVIGHVLVEGCDIWTCECMSVFMYACISVHLFTYVCPCTSICVHASL